ncbi:MAG: hypothetical protein ACNA7G_10535 [Methylobacter sp.]
MKTIIPNQARDFEMTKIEQLEDEIKKKIKELDDCRKVQALLRERLRNNNKILTDALNNMKSIEAYLKDSNEYLFTIKHENRLLKSSCDKWARRAIELEFKVLSVRDKAQK